MVVSRRGVAGTLDLKVVDGAAIPVAGEVVIDSGAATRDAVVAEKMDLWKEVKIAGSSGSEEQDEEQKTFHPSPGCSQWPI